MIPAQTAQKRWDSNMCASTYKKLVTVKIFIHFERERLVNMVFMNSCAFWLHTHLKKKTSTLWYKCKKEAHKQPSNNKKKKKNFFA